MSSPEASPGQALSPGLTEGQGKAFELKFLLSTAQGGWVESWAQHHLLPDAHGDSGRYRVTSLYCDTAGLDVFHRSQGYRRSKFRLRRYGSEERVYLERKSKRGDRVRKKRFEVHENELHLLATNETPPSWNGTWFQERVQKRALQPICHITYERQAFLRVVEDRTIRLTLDRELVGAPARDWQMPRQAEGTMLLADAVFMELKFHSHLPMAFRELLAQLPEQPARVSKYRRCVEVCGLAGGKNTRQASVEA